MTFRTFIGVFYNVCKSGMCYRTVRRIYCLKKSLIFRRIAKKKAYRSQDRHTYPSSPYRRSVTWRSRPHPTHSSRSPASGAHERRCSGMDIRPLHVDAPVLLAAALASHPGDPVHDLLYLLSAPLTDPAIIVLSHCYVRTWFPNSLYLPASGKEVTDRGIVRRIYTHIRR